MGATILVLAAVLGRWDVLYEGRSYDAAARRTTFRYTLSASADVHSLVIGTSGLIPVSSSGIVTGYVEAGWMFDDGQAAGTAVTYEITFAGPIGEAQVPYTVTGATTHEAGTVTGPGAPVSEPGTHELAGSLWVDANANGVRDLGEPPLASVTVEIVADGEIAGIVRTDAQGAYAYGAAPAGAVIRIPAETLLVEDFNEMLARYFDAGAGGGFAIALPRIAEDLWAGVLTGAGKTIGFWKHQLEMALANAKAQVPKNVLLKYLLQVEALYLAIPFDFPDGYEFAAALATLKNESSVATDLLAKQLLGSELNLVSGKGLDDAGLLEILIQLGELMIANSAEYTREQILDVKDALDAANNSGND